jgi:hypothetical protein
MKFRRGFTVLSSIFALAAVFYWMPSAHAAGDCGGGWVDDYTNEQDIGCTSEDTAYSGSQNFGDCYGQCGQGCSWYNCGSGGCCQTHDYYTRTQGLWSSAAMSVFPCAITQWGGCVTGRGKDYVNQYVVSKVTGAWQWVSDHVRNWN